MNKYFSLFHLLEKGDKKAWTRYKDNPAYNKNLPPEQNVRIKYKGTPQQEIIKIPPQILDLQATYDAISSGEIDNQITVKNDIKITQGRGKMGGIGSLNTDARDNPNCMKLHRNPKYICYECFSITGLEKGNQNSGPSKKINSKLLTKEGYPIGAFPARGVTPIFRVSSDGDFINEIHVKNVAHFLKQHIDSGKIQYCAIWSKIPVLMRFFVNYAKEIDLDLNKIQRVFSTYKFNEMNTKIDPFKSFGFTKTFTVYKGEFVEQLLQEGKIHSIKEFINCGARNCAGCKRCYTQGTVEIREMLKSDQKKFKKTDIEDEDSEEVGEE